MMVTMIMASAWIFHSAPHTAHPAQGREVSAQVREIKLADRGSCGWWETCTAVTPRSGVRVRARVEVEGAEVVGNDLTMLVRFDRPPHDTERGRFRGPFYQRDFVRWTDKVENGRLVRTFDDTFAVPGECVSAEVEIIAKRHVMTCTIGDFNASAAEPPKPRIVRCVVGNPYERRVDWKHHPEEALASRLGQIESTLTNIFAQVEHPDIILFSECFVGTGSNHAHVETIPGGPSWQLAAKYAVAYHCNIAFCIIERDELGQLRNTLFICDRKGKLAGRYRKVHLTSGEYQGGVVAGDEFNVIDLDFGRVGALICWDNWFSESIKMVKRNGAELVLFPLAGCTDDHVNACFPARAIDSGLPILVAMRQGHLPNGIIDRDGTWIAKTLEDGGFAVADIDLNERKRTYWLSVGPGDGDPYEIYYDESRPDVYEKFDWRQPRK